MSESPRRYWVTWNLRQLKFCKDVDFGFAQPTGFGADGFDYAQLLESDTAD
jgi:hypothetical protein